MIRKFNDQAGFTIVELMISTTIFTMVLLVAAAAIVQVGRMYFKGTIMSRTQDVSRRLGDDISQAIQFGSKAENDAGFRRHPANGTNFTNGTQTITANSYCIGGIRYTYVIGKSLGTAAAQSRHVLWKDRVSPSDSACAPVNMTMVTPVNATTLAGTTGEEFMGDNMRLAQFEVPASTTGIYSIDIIVATGETADLFVTGTNPPNSICKGSNAGGQFCATSVYSTLVGKRL